MNPQLSLGSWSAPEFELSHSELRTIIALLLEAHSTLTPDEQGHVWHLLTLDTLFLRHESLSFFLKFEDICNRIVSGELPRYDPEQLRKTEFSDYFRGDVGDGSVTAEAVASAQSFLDFLNRHPDYWPWSPDRAVSE